MVDLPPKKSSIIASSPFVRDEVPYFSKAPAFSLQSLLMNLGPECSPQTVILIFAVFPNIASLKNSRSVFFISIANFLLHTAQMAKW